MNTAVGEGRRKAAVAFIFITVALDMVANGVIGPVWPYLIKGFLGGDDSRSAVVFGIFSTIFAAAQVISAPIMGTLSDRYGRRPVILISCVGLGIDYLIMATAPNLGWLFVGRVLAGVTSANMSTAGAYIADVTAPEKRAEAYGMLSAAFGIGFIAGPMLGGLLGQFGLRVPFFAAAALTFANAAYGFFVLPESLAPENRAKVSLRMANPFATIGMLGASTQLLGLSAINFLARLVHSVFAVVWSLYVVERYRWGPWMIGVSLGVVGASSFVVSAGLVRPTVAWLGERRTLMVGLLFGATGFTALGLAPQGWMFLVAIFVLCLWGLATPCIQAFMSRLVGADQQGRLQGAMTGMTSIAGLIGPALFAAPFAYASTAAHKAEGLIGLPFYMAGGLMLVSMAIAWQVTRQPKPAAQPAI
jgi:DHA1 family tetracycline resistance protein-like MFS transporter